MCILCLGYISLYISCLIIIQIQYLGVVEMWWRSMLFNKIQFFECCVECTELITRINYCAICYKVDTTTGSQVLNLYFLTSSVSKMIPVYPSQTVNLLKYFLSIHQSLERLCGIGEYDVHRLLGKYSRSSQFYQYLGMEEILKQMFVDLQNFVTSKFLWHQWYRPTLKFDFYLNLIL